MNVNFPCFNLRVETPTRHFLKLVRRTRMKVFSLTFWDGVQVLLIIDSDFAIVDLFLNLILRLILLISSRYLASLQSFFVSLSFHNFRLSIFVGEIALRIVFGSAEGALDTSTTFGRRLNLVVGSGPPRTRNRFLING